MENIAHLLINNKVGDISILTYPTEAFRQKIAYISQKIEFLTGTLRFNLMFEQELSDEKIKMVLQSCFCNEFIYTGIVGNMR